jgi:GNAT superfamily N-acetyltransferase
MRPKSLRIDEAEITIRPMGLDYIMADTESEGIAVELACRDCASVWPNPIYVEYYTQLTRAYGAAAILAWQSKAVVGAVPFRPLESAPRYLPHCFNYVPEEPGDPDLTDVHGSPPIPFEDLESKTLVVQCAIVKPGLRGHGLGTAMATYLVDWAREHGWERIQGSAFIDGNWQWLPNVKFWEKAGFSRGTDEDSTLEFGPSCGFHSDITVAL